MKTKLLLKVLMILLISLNFTISYGQSEEGNDKTYPAVTPGDALISFSNTFYTGFVIQVVGIGTYCVAQIDMPKAEKSTITTISIIGGSVFLIGTIVELVSFGQIGKAGRLLNEQEISKENGVSIKLEGTQYGIGIVCRF
jgi:hypothetical protein